MLPIHVIGSITVIQPHSSVPDLIWSLAARLAFARCRFKTACAHQADNRWIQKP
jgi:hypothetical protein